MAETTSNSGFILGGPGAQATFNGLVLAVASSALIYLGESPHPEAEKPVFDVPNARQMISLLEVLEHKTRGNLERDEQQLLQSVLADLRLKVVAALQQQK